MFFLLPCSHLASLLTSKNVGLCDGQCSASHAIVQPCHRGQCFSNPRPWCHSTIHSKRPFLTLPSLSRFNFFWTACNQSSSSFVTVQPLIVIWCAYKLAVWFQCTQVAIKIRHSPDETMPRNVAGVGSKIKWWLGVLMQTSDRKRHSLQTKPCPKLVLVVKCRLGLSNAQ